LISERRSSALRSAFFPTLFVFLTAIFWAALYGDFIFDDFASIVDNPSMKSIDGTISSYLVAAGSGISSPLGRPLSMLSFSLNLFFFGDAPLSFKVTNLLIHFVNSALVFVLARQLSRYLEQSANTSRSWIVAAGTSAVWALHPANAIPVMYVVQRMTSLSALFVFSALSIYLYGRQATGKRKSFAIAASILVFWPLAVLSKETGLLLPVYIFLCEWVVLGTFRTTPSRVKWWAIVAATCTFVILCWTNWGFITAGYGVRDFDLTQRLMTEARVLWFYVRQLLVPTPQLFGLFHDDIPISRALFTPPETALAIVAWIAAVALAFQQRAKRPFFAFAVFWYLASHALESTIFPLEIAYEHRNYVASFGIFLWLAHRLLPAHEKARWPGPRMTLVISFAVFCGLLTGLRSLQWANEYQRSQAEVADHPESARANFQAAAAIMQRTFEAGGGNGLAYQSVQFYYRRAADLDKNSKAPLVGLVYLDCATGTPKNPVLEAGLLQRFSSARFTFGDRSIVQSLSGLLVEGRLCMDDQEVKALIDAALSNPSADGSMRGMINAVAMDYAAAKMHSIPLALTYAQAAVASDPGSVALRSNLIHLLLQANKVEDARREYMMLIESHRSARDKATLSGLKTLFDAIDKSANADRQVG
jgi:protein O-mannosyl-transferase